METLNAVLAVDLPDDPPWQDVQVRDYLAETMPGERRINWVAEDDRLPEGDSRIFAHVSILLLGDIGVLEVLVHPELRRRGLGRELVAVAARRAYLEGFSSIGVEAIGDTAGDRRSTSRSASSGSTWRPAACSPCPRWTGRRWARWPAASAPATGSSTTRAGRRRTCWRRTRRPSSRRRHDDSDLDLAPRSSDPQRLRDSLNTLHKRGLKPYIVLAIHEATGVVAGLTEVVVPAQHPERADQYDTIVVRDHRGYGIDRAIKARMLFELRSAEPALLEVQTWNAQHNESMLKVNAELGFQSDRDWYEYGADVAQLVQRLEPTD